MSDESTRGQVGLPAPPTPGDAEASTRPSARKPNLVIEFHLNAALDVPGSRIRVTSGDRFYEGKFRKRDEAWEGAFIMFCLRAPLSAGGAVEWRSKGTYYLLWKKRLYEKKGVPPLDEVSEGSSVDLWAALWKALRATSAAGGNATKGPWRIGWDSPPTVSLFRDQIPLESDEERLGVLVELEERAGIAEADLPTNLLPKFDEAAREIRASIRRRSNQGRVALSFHGLARQSKWLAVGVAFAGGSLLGYASRPLIDGERDSASPGAPAALAGSAAAPLVSARCGNANLVRWNPLDTELYKRTFGSVANDFRGYNAGFRLEDSPEHDQLQLARYAKGVAHRYLFTDCRYYCRARSYWLKLQASSATAARLLTKENPAVRILPRDGSTAHYFLGTGSGKTPIMYSYPMVRDGSPQAVLEIDDRSFTADLARHFKTDWDSPAAIRVDWTQQSTCTGAPISAPFCRADRRTNGSARRAAEACAPSATCSEWLEGVPEE